MFDEKFLEDNLDKILGISIPQDKKDDVMKALKEHIQKDMMAKISAKLNMKDKLKLMSMVVKSRNNPEELFKFLNDKIPNLQNIIQESVLNFRQEALKIIQGQ